MNANNKPEREAVQKAKPQSRPLDVNRWSDYPELVNCINQLLSELHAREVRVRKRKFEQAKRLREAVRVIVLDLYVAWKTDPDLLVGINLRKGKFGGNSRYDNLFLQYSSFKFAFDGLVALGGNPPDFEGTLA